MNKNDNIIDFNLPKNKSSVIKVIGVGGGGGNAINYMYENGIEGVDFAICNTDTQALEASPIPVKIQLGENLTNGLGAGSNPEVGKKAAMESIDRINELLDSNTNMLFITAGMGGGTGTGAAPVIAKAAKEKGILTVGVVTMPFNTEGGRRKEHARIGLEELRDSVDTLLVINNERLIEVYGDLKLTQAFSKANEVLNTATKGIAEVITQYLSINIDLSDARLVLQNSGTAIMGQAEAEGDNRAVEAVTKALDSPLLNDNDIKGSEHVLLKIVTGDGEEDEISMNELKIINDTIQEKAGSEVNIIVGAGTDPDLGSKISITVIATGFEVAEEKKEVKIPIGGDETIETIESKENNTSVSENIDKDFVQQSMLDFDDDIDFDLRESPIDSEIQKKSNSTSISVADNVVNENDSTETIDNIVHLDQKVVISLDEDLEISEDENNFEVHENVLNSDPTLSIENIQNNSEEINDNSIPNDDISSKLSDPIDKESLHNIASRNREERLKDISNILRTPSGLTNLIDEPAFKRDGLDLDATPHSSESEVSEDTLSIGEDNIVQLKQNNSFLHDNVD